METGKQVHLEVEGEATELDKTVIDRISEPLTHLIRNAIGHGLEMPEVRLARGKPAVGIIRLSAEQRGSLMIVTIRGDLDIVSSGRFDDCLKQARAVSKRILLDLAGVDFMDTSALAVIVGHWKKLKAEDGTLVLAGGNNVTLSQNGNSITISANTE